MPISMEDFVTAVDPGHTTLVFGAGASIPSGAPSGAQLAEHLWREVAHSEPISDDLVDTASILVRRYGRADVINAVISALKSLKPSGGLLGLPAMGWRAYYSTNFDQLIESAFKQAGIPLAVYRSNFDFTRKEASVGVKYFKIHGCITQDESLGDKSSMVLTADDYASHERFKQVLFGKLKSSLLDGDAIIIGQSLSDRHLSDLVKDVLAAKQEGAPGNVYVLVFDRDDLRAPLLEDKGARIVFGGIDEMVHAFGNASAPTPSPTTTHLKGHLPLSLISSVVDAKLADSLAPNVSRMFHGAPATYADIRQGATFEREGARGLTDHIVNGGAPVFAIVGAAGVGKTTFARQLLRETGTRIEFAWEHRSDFPFQDGHWLTVESKLRAAGQVGALLLDECTPHMRAVNRLVEALNGIENPALRFIVTANSAQWTPRMKSPVFFSKGRLIELSSLADEEIYSLINLVEFNKDISSLVTQDFKRQSRGEQFSTLRRKCSSDMFVCLKNVFATESLDDIILEEYNDLPEPLQDYYRYVSALQSVGAKVHRQLIIRMLKMPPDNVAAVLAGLDGIIDEYDVEPAKGIYGWTARHLVIARKISEYKFSSFKDLVALFETLIENVDPALPIELQTIRNICDAEYGIGRLGDRDTRMRLFQKLIDTVPGERIPWHRMIRESLDSGDFRETEHMIRAAEEAVGVDAPIDRYKVRLMIVRARNTPRISDGDRLAILRKAYEAALSNIGRHKWDKLAFSTLCDVAVELVERGESEYLLEEALQTMRDGADRIQDPQMFKQIRHYEGIQARLRH